MSIFYGYVSLRGKDHNDFFPQRPQEPRVAWHSLEGDVQFSLMSRKFKGDVKKQKKKGPILLSTEPMGSMYGIFAYIWVVQGVKRRKIRQYRGMKHIKNIRALNRID